MWSDHIEARIAPAPAQRAQQPVRAGGLPQHPPARARWGMSGYASPDHPEQRLSDAEREQAVGHLAAAQSEGRLTAADYAERSVAARHAVTWADLVPLFADLPDSAPAQGPEP